MQRAQPVNSRMSKSLDRRRDPTADPAQYGSLGHNDAPPSPASSTGTPVFVTATPRSDSPTSMAGKSLRSPSINAQIRGWQ